MDNETTCYYCGCGEDCKLKKLKCEKKVVLVCKNCYLKQEKDVKVWNLADEVKFINFKRMGKNIRIPVNNVESD